MKICPKCEEQTENEQWEYCRPCKNEDSEFIRLINVEDFDPTPYCSYGHKTAKQCDCGPNE